MMKTESKEFIQKLSKWATDYIWLSGQHFQFSEGHVRGDIKIVLQIENRDFTALQNTVSLENVLDISIEPFKTLLSFFNFNKIDVKSAVS